MPKLKLSILLFVCLLFLPLSGVFASEATSTLGGDENYLGSGLEGTVPVSPTASVDSGTYTSSRSVTLTAASSNSIRYTLDGSAPACPATGTLYVGAITVNSNKTLKAIACYVSDNSVPSTVSTYTYAFVCATASVTNGTVGAYSGCAITCNSGYVLSGNSCVAQGGGGGGGGSSIQPSTTTVPVTGMTIAQLQAEVARIQALILQLQIQLLQMLGGETTNIPFLTDLQYGMANNSEVKRLQEFLISKGFLAAGYNTGNYYQLTANAVAAYQASKGITPTNGRCGPKTRAAINADLGITL